MEIELTDKVPKELTEFKIEHFKEIFRKHWEEVFIHSPSLDEREEQVVIRDLGSVVGGCAIQRNVYSIRFRNFSVLPGNRGKGYAKKLMLKVEDIARKHHEALIESGNKPQDIDVMYVRSLVYPIDSEFSPFLQKFGFTGFSYNKHELSKEEKAAIQIYGDRELQVFKKLVVDNGVEFREEVKQELSELAQREWDIVMGGLNWKLGNYGKTGKVSYRYDLCPICEDVGSSEQDSDNCKKCYIYQTCLEPFREVGRFKEDFEVSQAYFSEMRRFMLANKPEGRK